MTTTLHLLCAGAAQGLVKSLQARWLAETGSEIGGRFGAVGALKEALLAGEPCDVMITTDAMAGALVREGRLRGEAQAALGRVRTGIAVREGDARPDVSSPQALRAALLAADAVYFPDAERSTAGSHFAGLMRELGIGDALRARRRPFPNGATAMRELAASTAARPIGCTQLSEILDAGGVAALGALPPPFELATVYTAAVSASAADAALGARFVALLAGSSTAASRRQAGFEPSA